jgi:uncharacterized protein (DUF302 family)
MFHRFARHLVAALLAAAAVGLSGAQAESPVTPAPNAAGVISVPSAYGMIDTVERLQKVIAAKGILFFGAVNQGELAAVSGVAGVKPSVLLSFGNPPLGTQFLAANQQAGLDWPVRMLVYVDRPGHVMISWTDFAWIAKRHGLQGLDAQLKMAAEVAASIASAATH